MPHLDRRRFLTLASATAAASTLPAFALPRPTSPGTLRLIFLTDTHTQPELSASEGTALAFAKVKSLKPDLCIQGGDHAMDLCAVPRDRSVILLDLYQKTEQSLDGIPIHHVIGNHDIFGRDPRLQRRHLRPPLRQESLRAALPHQNLPLLRSRGLPLHPPRLHPDHPQPRLQPPSSTPSSSPGSSRI